jgi:hypothetical protein
MGWKAWGSNPSAGKIFRTPPYWPWDPPSLLYNGYWVSFLGVERPGRGVDHQPLSSAEIKKQYSCTSTVPLWPVVGRPLPLPYLPNAVHSCSQHNMATTSVVKTAQHCYTTFKNIYCSEKIHSCSRCPNITPFSHHSPLPDLRSSHEYEPQIHIHIISITTVHVTVHRCFNVNTLTTGIFSSIFITNH